MNNTNNSKFKKPTYDLFLSYSHKDNEFAELLYKELSEFGLRVFDAQNSIQTGEEYSNVITSAIGSARYFVPIITKQSINSAWCMKELELALSRSKLIIPICFSWEDIRSSDEICFYISRLSIIEADDFSQRDAARIAKMIADTVGAAKSEDDDFELLSDYIKSGATNNATRLLCKLVNANCQKLFKTYSPKQRKEFIVKLFPLLDKLQDIYDFDYGKEANNLGHMKINVLGEIEKVLYFEEFKTDDLFYISSAIRLIYYDREIRWTAIDAITHGDLSDGIIKVPVIAEEKYEQKQRDFVIKYERELLGQSNDEYTDDDWHFICDTQKYIYKKDKIASAKEKKEEKKSTDEELLIQVASFMREGNKVFDLISENQQAEEFFRCLILSYERLKKYCEVVGEQKVCAECIDRIFELNKKINSGFVGAKSTTKAQDGLKTLLGLTVPKSGRFDVFISHKSEDTDIASDMYYYLKQNLKEAFYDKETLPEMSESQYRKSIMQALDGSTHFVLILSDLSFLNSYWVNLEMEVFQSEIDEGRKPNSNFIIVVTKEVYDEIMKSNKAALPIEYRRCEIMKVEDYKTKLLSYLSKCTLK